jgi:ubiquinone/menaquinone biosynthesis C-methylase UbiE
MASLPDHTKLENCPLCDSTSHELWRQKDGYNIVRCKDCSFIFVEDYPSAEFLRDFYAPTYQPDGEEFVPAGSPLRKLKYQAFVKWISGKFPKGQTIKTLEIGCGQGDFQSAVKNNPRFEARGFDYSEACVNYAQSQGLDVELGDFQSAGIEDNSQDLVIALHVLEHVHDLNQIIGEFHRALKPGGLAFAVCPSVTHFKEAMAGESWKYLGPPGHLWYLSPKTFPGFFKKAGFSEILHCSHFYHRAHVRILARK